MKSNEPEQTPEKPDLLTLDENFKEYIDLIESIECHCTRELLEAMAHKQAHFRNMAFRACMRDDATTEAVYNHVADDLACMIEHFIEENAPSEEPEKPNPNFGNPSAN